MIYLVGVIGILLITSVYVNWNLLRKIQFYEAWVESAAENIRLALEEMRTVDLRGSFEADDEVGTTFRRLFATVLSLESVMLHGEPS